MESSGALSRAMTWPQVRRRPWMVTLEMATLSARGILPRIMAAWPRIRLAFKGFTVELFGISPGNPSLKIRSWFQGTKNCQELSGMQKRSQVQRFLDPSHGEVAYDQHLVLRAHAFIPKLEHALVHCLQVGPWVIRAEL